MKLVSLLLYMLAFAIALAIGLAVSHFRHRPLVVGLAFGWFVVMAGFLLFLAAVWVRDRIRRK